MLRHFLRYWLPLLLYMLTIVVVSSLERPPKPDIDWQHIDKVYHALEYSVLGFLAYRAFHWTLSRRHYPTLVIAILTIAFCVAFGISDEIHQRFVERREASVWDLGADSLGAFVGLGLGLVGDRLRPRSERRPYP